MGCRDAHNGEKRNEKKYETQFETESDNDTRLSIVSINAP